MWIEIRARLLSEKPLDESENERVACTQVQSVVPQVNTCDSVLLSGVF